MNATRLLAGRREGNLLAFPSVRRMTAMLSLRCRESSGRSVRSGAPIPDERLEADPAAELTVEEAQQG